jgi:hypothetical protein
MKADLQLSYTAVGHVSVDVLEDGSRQPGGGAFYSALQAARLGLDARIVTRGVASEIEALLAPFSGELRVQIEEAPFTTTLLTHGAGSSRSQRVLAWAGSIEERLEVHDSILHLAPIARETPSQWRGEAAFVGLTPQGLVREWTAPDAQITGSTPSPATEAVADGCDAVVVSALEREHCNELIERARAAGAVVAITDGGAPNTLLYPDGSSQSLSVPALAQPSEDLGAGDVFAAAFFVALSQGSSAAHAAGFANAAAAVRMGAGGAHAIGGIDAIQSRLSAVASPAG